MDDIGEESQPAGAIGMDRDQLELDARHLPEKAGPDEQPEIPAEEQELEDGHADQRMPPAGERQVGESGAALAAAAHVFASTAM